MALPVSCLLEVYFSSLTNRLGDARWSSPSMLGWWKENISRHNNAEGLDMWLACISLLWPKSGPRFPFLSLYQRRSNDRKLLDPRACWAELLWRDLIYNWMIVRIIELISLDDTRIERNQRRNKSDGIEIAVLRNEISLECSYSAWAEAMLSKAWRKFFVSNGGRCKYGTIHLKLPKFGGPAVILPAWRFVWHGRCLKKLICTKICAFQYRDEFPRRYAPNAVINRIMGDSSEVPIGRIATFND
jgi:hypothetical protein